jgi:hypothetical protein
MGNSFAEIGNSIKQNHYCKFHKFSNHFHKNVSLVEFVFTEILESDNDEVDYFDAFISKKFQTTALN